MNQEPGRQEPEQSRRVSIWSVPEDWQVWYLALFNIQTLCLTGLVSWYRVSTSPQGTGPVDILIAIGTSMAGLVILTAAESIFLTDITKMLFTIISDKYLKRQRAKGREEGLAQGIEQGIKEGRVSGFVEAHEKWADWYERRMKAEAAGEDFDEPPPSYPSSNGSG